MGTRKKRGIPAQLEKVRRRFEAWRRNRTVRTRIPDSLWAAAVKVAERHGVHRTAKALRVDYYGLKKRVEEKADPSANVPVRGDVATFVELASPLSAGSVECLVELEDDSGAKMRVHLKGVEAPDLVALSGSFWGILS
jgi:hypothetical protein